MCDAELRRLKRRRDKKILSYPGLGGAVEGGRNLSNRGEIEDKKEASTSTET